ncbi:hypothetical protein IP88_15380 [alpha proteobacterium AAP81b]|nr:hypothetical protein IP88_15380 [alpha proteobacterium AAP81b]
MSAPDTTALMVRWLTHDLASPVATALTASELLGDTADAEINGLVQDAARRLAARLRLVRTAFAPGEAAIGNRALETLIRAGIGDTPLVWARDGDCSGAEASLIAGAALLLADLRRAAPLTVADDGVRWGDAWAIPAGVAEALAGGAPGDPRSAVAAMVAAAAARQGASLTATADGIGWR